MSGEADAIGQRLNQLLKQAGLREQPAENLDRFQRYYDLYTRWNAKLNLSAIRDREGILSRHFVESIACAQAIPAEAGSLLDLGAGGGFPGVPIALCRPAIAITLAESQTKKAAFLHELVRTLDLTVRVHHGRAEQLAQRFDCATLRAVDRMGVAVQAAVGLLQPGGWLVLMTTQADAGGLQEAAGPAFDWSRMVPVGHEESGRIILLGHKA